MSVDTAVVVSMGAIQIGALLVVAVWGISKIRTTTEGLQVTIKHLTKQIDEAKEAIQAVCTIVTRHGERIAKLEVKKGARR